MNTKAFDDSIKEYFRILLASKKEKNVKQKNRYDAVLLYMEGLRRSPSAGSYSPLSCPQSRWSRCR